MRYLIVYFSLLTVFGFSQTLEIDEIEAIDKDIYSEIIEFSYGDLDGDENIELLLVLNRLDTANNNTPRDLVVLKMDDLSWYVWKKSSTTILGSEEGGVMGDPFQWAYIDSNKIHISHRGGSRWRWSESHIYSFKQDTFSLNLYNSTFGAFCEDKLEVNFNLILGNVTYSVDIEECPEGFGNNNHLLESLPITEEFSYKDLRIDLFNDDRSIIEIITPLNNTFSLR
jgi:hypothetical protein